VVPAELPGASVARGYRLAYGRDPARDPERHATRAYSRSELEAALAALERRKPRQAPPPPPADPLKLLWEGALARLQLPSTRMFPSSDTRMFLSQEGRLLELRESTYPGRGPSELVARVAVPSGWPELLASRIHLIGNALGEVLGRVVAVELVEADR
jgi:hypothetical protein